MPAEPSLTPSPTTSNTTSMDQQFSPEAAINLALLDPPKWGWSAGGGIVNLCTPHEMARRKEARDRFLEEQKLIEKSEEKKSLSNENEKSVDKITSTHDNTNNNNINNNSVTFDTNSVENKDVMFGIPKQKNDSNNETIGVSKEDGAKVIVSLDDKEKCIVKSESDAKIENIKKLQAPVDVPVDRGEEIKEVKRLETNKKGNSVTILSKDTNKEEKEEEIPVEGGILRRSKQSDGTMKQTIHFDGMSEHGSKLDIYSYHRGRSGLEPRDKADGMLLDCETWSQNEANSGYDAPLLKLKVRVEFPLVEEEIPSESEEENEENNDTSKNQRLDSTNEVDKHTNESSQGIKITRTRSKQHQTNGKTVNDEKHVSTNKVKRPKTQIPIFSEEIDWDLSDPETLTPMDFATDIAQEFGLSFCQTLELASSIQSQIDIHCQKNIKYCIPITKFDPVSRKPRENGHLQPPPISSIPNILYGGHAGTSITSTAKSIFNERELEKHQSIDGNQTTSYSRNKLSNKLSTNRRSGKVTEVVPEHLLPSHDGIPASRSRGSGIVRKSVVFTTDKTYRDEVLRRLKDEFRQKVREQSKEKGLTEDKDVFRIKYDTNCVCHICHARKEDCALFPCDYYAHNYCESHTSTRLGFRASDCKDGSVSFDFCPICCLTCLCPKCARKLDAISIEFQSKCDALGLTPQDNLECVEMKCLPLTVGYNYFGVSSPSGLGGSKKKKKAGKHGRPARTGRKPIDENSPSTPITKSKVESCESVHSHGTRNRGKRDTSNKIEQGASTTVPDLFLDVKPESKHRMHKNDQLTKKQVAKVCPSEFPIEIREGKDSDPSLDSDHLMIFTPSGCFPKAKLGLAKKKNNFEKVFSGSGINGSSEESLLSKDVGTVEDGNVDYCLICNNSGGLVCCDTCPRAFHLKCINSRDSNLAQLESKWECHECKKDREEQIDDTIILPSEKTRNLISAAFQPFEKLSNFEPKVNAIIQIYEIIQFLINWDFGHVFENPLNVEELPGYLDLVERPMDLGTIATRIIHGKYSSEMKEKLIPSSDGKDSILDEIFILILTDIETVWHNCLIYNQEGSAVHRMAQVLRKKFMKVLKNTLRGNLSPYVLQKFGEFVENQRQIRREILQSSAKKQGHETKHTFELPKKKSGNCKPIAIFDPDTKMVVKQYVTQQAALIAAVNLSKRGFDSEFPINPVNVHKAIRESHNDPRITIFGYRWMYIQNLRNGNFVEDSSNNESKITRGVNNKKKKRNNKVSSKSTKRSSSSFMGFRESSIIYKFDKISKQVMSEFGSLNEAYHDWLKTGESSIEKLPDENTIDVFEMVYVNGSSDLDGIEWHRIESNKIEKKDHDSIIQHEDNENTNVSSETGVQVSSAQKTIHSSMGPNQTATNDTNIRGEKRQHEGHYIILDNESKKVKIKLHEPLEKLHDDNRTVTMTEGLHDMCPHLSPPDVSFQSVVSICKYSLSILERFESVGAAARSASVDEETFLKLLSQRKIVNGKVYVYSSEANDILEMWKNHRDTYATSYH